MKVEIGSYPEGPGERPVSVEITSEDTYTLSHTLALVIHPGLCKFREEVVRMQCHPGGMETVEEWLGIIDSMILAFAYMLDEDKNEFTDEYNDVVVEGLALFTTYYRNLWW